MKKDEELVKIALEKLLPIDEFDDWDFPKRMKIRQAIENSLIILEVSLELKEMNNAV